MGMPRIKLSEDIQPLTTFRNHSVEMVRQLRESQRPIVLTVNGKPEAVIQDVEAYQRLLDLAALADESEGIRQGEEDIDAGRTRPAEEFFAAFEAKHRIRG
jgi:prevent-host-death family protein